MKLCGMTDNDENENEDEIRVKVSVSFFEVKKWFRKKYPHFTEEAEARKREIKKLLGKEYSQLRFYRIISKGNCSPSSSHE